MRKWIGRFEWGIITRPEQDPISSPYGTLMIEGIPVANFRDLTMKISME